MLSLHRPLFVATLSCALIAFAWGSTPARAQYEPPEQGVQESHEGPAREGFTIKLSMGMGIASLLYAKGDTQSYGGVGGLNVSLGKFFNPLLALLFKGSMVLFGPFSKTFDTGLIATFGPAVQYWLADWLHVEAGAGAGINVVEFRRAPTDVDIGGAFTLGLGVSLYSGHDQAVGLFGEFAAVFPPEDPTLAMQLGVMWQYY